MTRLEFSHLGVAFGVYPSAHPCNAYLENAFLNAYDDHGAPYCVAHPAIDIEIRDGSVPLDGEGDEVPVHRARSFSEWNIDSRVVTTSEGRSVLLKGKGIRIDIPTAGNYARMTVDPSLHPHRTGEHVYTVLRNLALYKRDAWAGNLLHASGVVGPAGVIAFVGASMAGKTTLMVHAMLSLGLQPFANDRMFLRFDGNVESWPSYLTLCEGTILAHPRLHAAAIDYDRFAYPYVTTSSTRELTRAFTKDRKRLFPMHWVSTIVGSTYRRHDRLAAIVFPRLAPGQAPVFSRVPLNSAEQRATICAALKEQSFDQKEDGFPAWHGLPFPVGAPPLDKRIENFFNEDLPIFELQGDPEDAEFLARSLREVLHISAQCNDTRVHLGPHHSQ